MTANIGRCEDYEKDSNCVFIGGGGCERCC